MRYRVIEGFYDLQDKDGKGNCHLYNKGDVYPREGIEPTKERVADLSGMDNKRRQPLIEEIPEEKGEGAVPEGAVPDEAGNQAEKAARTRRPRKSE